MKEWLTLSMFVVAVVEGLRIVFRFHAMAGRLILMEKMLSELHSDYYGFDEDGEAEEKGK